MDNKRVYELKNFKEHRSLDVDMSDIDRLIYSPKILDSKLIKQIEPSLSEEELYDHMKSKSGWMFNKGENKDYYKEECIALLQDNDFNTFSRYGKKTNRVYMEAKKAYDFDSNLRNFLQQILEKIEIYIKKATADAITIGYDKKSTYILDDNDIYFNESDKNYRSNNKKRKDTVLRTKYEISKLIDIKHDDSLVKQQIKEYGVVLPWTIFRMMTFGNITGFLVALQPNYREKVIEYLNVKLDESQKVTFTVLISWLDALKYLRNTCSHNGILYDTLHTKIPIIHNYYVEKYINVSNPEIENFDKKLFVYFLAMRSIINTMSSLSKDFWNEKIKQLEIESSERQVDLEKYGFPNNWLEILKIN